MSLMSSGRIRRFRELHGGQSLLGLCESNGAINPGNCVKSYKGHENDKEYRA